MRLEAERSQGQRLGIDHRVSGETTPRRQRPQGPPLRPERVDRPLDHGPDQAIGRRGGHPLMMRYGHHVGLNDARMRLGEYLFRLHGGKILLFGRIMAVLRVYQAILAGTYRMPLRKFFVFNALGAVIWAAAIGYGAYGSGELFNRMAGELAWAALAIGVALLVGSALYLRRQEGVLQAQADADTLQGEQRI